MTTTTPDFRALCAELIAAIADDSSGSQKREDDAIARARAALATPPPEPVAYIHRQGNHWEVSERVLLDDEKKRGWTEEPLYADTPPPEPLTGQIIFNAPPTEEVIRLNKEGFHYKGQFIADAGEAHRLMLAFLEQNTKTKPEPPTDEEIAAAIQKGADQEFYATVEALAKYCDAGVELTDSDAREVLYELRRPHIMLDHWGNEKQ
jgi:hypothetical protein